MSNYKVVNTFDSERLAWRQADKHIALVPSNRWTSGKLFSRGAILPNAPMRAKDTLLAQLVKTGLHSPENMETIVHDDWGEQSIISRWRRGRKPEHAGVRRRPYPAHPTEVEALKGKLIGVEIEFYPARRSREYVSAFTDMKCDGSLGDGGRELVKLTWANVEGRLAGLLKLDLEGRIDTRCGLHVHIDVRHLPRQTDVQNATGLLTVEETYDRLCEFYTQLKKLVPPSRLKNRYCRWMNNRPGARKRRKRDRHAAINWYSVSDHGTIEFRCQGGSIEPVKIETWALLCQYLVKYASNPATKVPRTWDSFLAILPEPFRTWCILRRAKPHGQELVLNERSQSA